MKHATDMLRDIIGVQRELFSLVDRNPELKDDPLKAHTHRALTAVTELYNNSLIYAMKQSDPATAQKLENLSRQNPEVSL
jgi:hypothetical protein